MEYDIIIVGAGASGLMAAIAAARIGSSVLVIDRKEKAGKKILATGNGKCNFTNQVQTPDCYRSDDSAFPMKVLSNFDVVNTLHFFEELGIYPKERNGYYYPNSEQAASIVQVLLMECERLQVEILYDKSVVAIEKPDFTIITEGIIPQGNYKNNNERNTHTNRKNNSKLYKSFSSGDDIIKQSYKAKKLILSTGGCASPQLGSDGSGFALAKSLGHNIIKPLPALVQLKSPDKFCKTVSGVRTQVKVSAFVNQKEVVKEEGEILFTDYGISGIPIMQISRFVAKALNQGEPVELSLDFLPELSVDMLQSMLLQRIRQNLNKNLEEMMLGLLNHKLSYIIIMEAKLDPYKVASSLNEAEIKLLARQIKEFRMKINDTNSFDNAQVCAGGVNTTEIDHMTMESKKRKNLYLTGELVDVDGTCGGYNLQWAWSSGYLAGTAAAKG